MSQTLSVGEDASAQRRAIRFRFLNAEWSAQFWLDLYRHLLQPVRKSAHEQTVEVARHEELQ
jgi:hypothetical protein